MSVGSMLSFNTNDGYLDGILRGYRSGVLTSADYANLIQCDTLDDLKLHLQSTDYGDFLANEPSPLATTTIHEKCTEKLVKEFMHLRDQAVEPLGKFLDYMTYGYMIDNILLLITGTLHERDIRELVDKCHPLGMFESMPTLTVAKTASELYNSVIVDTPLAPFFQDCLSEEDFSEMEIEIIRNTLYKAYLEDFHRFCVEELGGTTAEVMGELLEFEADRRTITITQNSFETELSKDDRAKLYPSFGKLYPEGTRSIGHTSNVAELRKLMESYGDFRRIFDDVDEELKKLENAFDVYSINLNRLSFEQCFHYGVFYSYVKLKEQEIRNIVWIAECIAQDQKGKINNYIPIF
jgi:V-type H+-transporting ATPase subunit d